MTWSLIVILLGITFSMPNTQEIMARFEPALARHISERKAFIEPLRPLAERVKWYPSATWAVLVSVVGVLAVLGMSQVSEFLYFQF